MSEDTDKNYLSSLDRRITDHDQKLTSVGRDYTELSHEIKELMNRINNGLSPSVNKVKDDNAEIKLQIKELSHDLELDMKDMKSMVRESTELSRAMIDNFDKARVAPMEKEVGFMKKTFVYGLVGALIVFAGHKIMDLAWDKFFKTQTNVSVNNAP